MPNKFEAGTKITQYNNLTGERHKWNIGMWAEAAFTSHCDLGIGVGRERCRDFGAGCIELRTCPVDIAAEGAEAVGIDANADADAQAKRAIQQRRDHPLLAMHGREHRRFVSVWSGRRWHR